MGLETFDTVETTAPPDGCVWRSEQRNSTLARLPGVTLLSALAGLIVAPQIALAAYALGDAQSRATIAQDPIVAVQLAIALIFWFGLVIWPLRRGLSRLSQRRVLTIDATTVIVDETNLFGRRRWSEPLASYRGLTHHVRSSLSGLRHELVLVHPDRARSLLVAAAEHMSDADVDLVRSHLRVGPVTPDELYRRLRRPSGATITAKSLADGRDHALIGSWT